MMGKKIKKKKKGGKKIFAGKEGFEDFLNIKQKEKLKLMI